MESKETDSEAKISMQEAYQGVGVGGGRQLKNNTWEIERAVRRERGQVEP